MNPDPKLTVCDKCGWYGDLYGHADRCAPLASKRAAELESELSAIPSTRFGYGHRMLTFVPDEHMHVRLSVSDQRNDRKPFRFEDLWMIDDLSSAEASDLVRTVTDWRARMLAARRSKT